MVGGWSQNQGKRACKNPYALLLVDKSLGLPVINDAVEPVRTVVDIGQEQLVSDHTHVPRSVQIASRQPGSRMIAVATKLCWQVSSESM
jgi:hypothetical protein